MADTKELINQAYQIEKLLGESEYQDIKHVLDCLEDIIVTLEQLQETNIIKALYRVLRTCPEASVKNKAKCLLTKWKRLYKNHCHQPTGQQEGSAGNRKGGFQDLDKTTEVRSTQHHLDQNETQAFSDYEMQNINNLEENCKSSEFCMISEEKLKHDTSEICAEAVCKLSNKDIKTDNLSVAPTPNQQSAVDTSSDTVVAKPSLGNPQANIISVRSKCTKLLSQALISEETTELEAQKCNEVALNIEENIFVLHGKNVKKYKASIRSKISNMRNPKTSHLRQSLLCGQLSPKTFAEMSAMEMASNELKHLRAVYTESAINEHQLPQGVEGTKTKKIKCRRCEKFDCTVTVIARGTLFLPGWVRNGNPDEEMMTFVTCNGCGEKWYNSRWVCF
ncbi:Transcription elongation factor A N-terminal and central domain-containing protein [Acipenser ruthenus]|uniref:Transcription elongation factor A N-terminal and central domain-containing protein n=2 Tax=Acipenser ruthenus TaxID=7906 RepID=A0A444U160_ACIRT|nr:transcription elongation factor A N-terminal and central domain-containing protein isoform X2 [Acipenser ruthenus]XP_058884977.1 transcription elongation factor A N-terminal and central domain-containing protein isoform X2 [Acipenser ruthenus]RXM28892.1 Transcription elongation factor A N-terminal and central domain-containing protein [Acipenser ruthenus]